MKIYFHGILAEEIGESWDLEVSSVAEAMRAIEANTKKLRKWFLSNIETYEYQVLVNKKNFLTQDLTGNISEKHIFNSELYANIEEEAESIDIVPVVKGSLLLLAFGGLLFAGGVALAATTVYVGVGITLAVVGLGLIAAGTSQLLSKPPPTVPFTAQQVNPIQGDGESGGPVSYLFNGPVNTAGEGGPVPIGYGELTVGGHSVVSNYEIMYRFYKSDYTDETLQASIYGTDRYLINSRGFLASQAPFLAEP